MITYVLYMDHKYIYIYIYIHYIYIYIVSPTIP